MNCSDFLERYSEFFDAPGGASETEEFYAHMSGCESCTRYHGVVSRGVELLRGFPPQSVPESFSARLSHRILHVRDERALGGRSGLAGPAGITAFGMTILVAAVAWLPLVDDTLPEVVIEPIVVSGPPSMRVTPASFDPFRPRANPTFQVSQELWDDPNGLLYRFSPISTKYEGSGRLLQTGFD